MSIDNSKKAQISHIMGVDFGKSKIGLAMADSETKIATVYDTIKNDKNFLNRLAEIIEKENIKKVVIGLPKLIRNGDVKYDGQILGKTIEDFFPKIEIFYQNEMFTTKMAQENLKAAGKKNVGRIDDGEAARIILQEWLDGGIINEDKN